MTMGISDKIANANINSWLTDELSDEELKAAEYIASIAQSIQKQRRTQGLTQKQLADRLGVSQAMVSQWENGEENFTVTTLVRISSALGLSLSSPISA
jgi:DNA-binding transcriptional regulator YiaG